ncbi:MAG TPA: ATP synthase subunit I [Steroidobacteraceae bacterium]|nr:ATP synthase subunit I [Steroidobacteraceae bacterium]
MITAPTGPGGLPFAATAGFAVGVGYFALMWHGVQATRAAQAWRAAALMLARLALAGVFLWSMARLGRGCLLAAFLGFLAARLVALRRLREPA